MPRAGSSWTPEEADLTAACCIPIDHFCSIRPKRQIANAIIQVATNIPTMMNPAVLILKFSNQ